MASQIKSKRTGGPQTEVGKAIASRNSTKSGVYSNQVTLPGESLEDYSNLESLFVDDFKPIGVAEISLVRDLAILTWKKSRLERIERSVLIAELERPIDEKELIAAGFISDFDITSLLKDYNLITAETVKSCKEQIKTIQDVALRVSRVKDFDKLQVEDPKFYEFLEIFVIHSLGSTDHLETMLTSVKKLPSGIEKLPFQVLCDFHINSLNAKIWVYENKDLVEKTISKVKEFRLNRLLHFEGSRRATDDLNRAFFKTLSEIRKQQEWRKNHEIINVTPIGEVK
jgi:hypothetical protein